MKKYEKMTKDEKEKIGKLFLQEKTSKKDFSKKYNISLRQLNYILKEFQIPSQLVRNYSVNERYFDNIDNGNKAYLVGYMLADGYVGTEDNRINISSKDFTILEDIRKEIQLEKEVTTGSKGSYKGSSDMYKIEFTNKQIASRLRKFGIYPHRKTKMKKIPDDIPKKYIWDFIRGYFDGDGCITRKQSISTVNGKIYNYDRLIVSIIGSKSFLENLVEEMEIRKSTFANSHTDGLEYLNIRSNDDIRKIYQKFYIDTNSTLFMASKKKIFDERINILGHGQKKKQ